MRRVAVILILCALGSQAFAAKQLAVQKLQQFLAESHSKPDAEVARQLSDLRLTERLSSTRLAQLKSILPGEKSLQELTILADDSSFLPLPPSEIPPTPVPDTTEQRRIMGLVVTYIGKTIPQLPNFIATRKTIRFEDTPLTQRLDSSGFTPYEPLHFIDVTDATVLYRDGHEVVDSDSARTRKRRPMAQGLTTWGVFGPILGTVLVDAAQSKLTWARWEQGPSNLQAVFSYSVPKEKSHYQVNYCCVAEEAAVRSANVHPFQKVVGYQGELAVDPATGTILRLTVEAELKPADPIVKAGIMVEYGSVEIGGKTYICPVRSVSSTRAQVVQLDPVYKMPLAREMQPMMNSLSDVVFENYHVFRSESRVLADDHSVAVDTPTSANTSAPQQAAAMNAGALPPLAQGTAAPPVPPTQSETSAAQKESDLPPSSNEKSPSAQPAVASAHDVVPEMTTSAANGLPEAITTPTTAAPGDSSFTLRSTSRLVDLSVVAFDKKGHPITDLKREDFTVYDNRVEQRIRFFSQTGETRPDEPANPNAIGSGEEKPAIYSNRPPTSTGASSNETERETTILLIDSSNLAWGDLTYAREEMLRFLKTVPTDQRVGLFILKSYSVQVLMEPTTDHLSLAKTLSKWMPSAQDLARAQAEEQRNREHIDFVHSAADLAHLNGNQSTAPDSYASSAGQAAEDLKYPTDAQLRQMGGSPGKDALVVIEEVGRHLAAIPGHKTLVWIASDNVLADWSNQTSTKEEKGSGFIHSAALRAQETLNEAHVSIYPLDASQLEAGVISADLRERNAVPVGMTSRSPELAELGDATPGMKPGRETARMQQDLHPIAGEYRDLAEATGGRALRRAGDIAAELNGIVEDGRAAYQISFSPDTPADDKYHNIIVKVAGRKDVSLRYRTGYLYSKEPQTMKERFQQAIWQPRDAGEIGVNVMPQKTNAGYKLILNIAAADLGLKEQGGLWTDKLYIFLVARDQATAKARMTGQTLGLRLKPGTYQRVLREGITFEQQVELKPANGSLRVLLVDENSSRIGTVTLPVTALGAKQ